MPNMATTISSHNKNLLSKRQDQRPPSSLLATAAIQRIALSMENAAKRPLYTKPQLHRVALPNAVLGALKRNSTPIITITPTPSDIERKEMRRYSQKRFGMLKILAISLYSNGLLLIEILLTNPGLDAAIYA